MSSRVATVKTSVIASALLIAFVATPAATAVTVRYRCYAVRPGETAAEIATRVTGDPLNRRASGFQIFDARRRLVPKAEYDLIQPGWRICIADVPWQAPIRPAVVRTVERNTDAARASAPTGSDLEPAFIEQGFFWWLVLIGGVATVVFAVTSSWNTRRMCAHEMQRFGTDFLREFARPWSHYRGASPLPRMRLRMSPRRARVEILVAPSSGRTYPNLTDHRINVEYDIARVTATLRRDSFATGQPYAEGEWVVLPFHLQKEGVR
jgi:hypothetical protein